MSVELSKQKLHLDEAAMFLQREINRLAENRRILLAGIKAIDQDKENMLESKSILACEVRTIMRKLNKN